MIFQEKRLKDWNPRSLEWLDHLKAEAVCKRSETIFRVNLFLTFLFHLQEQMNAVSEMDNRYEKDNDDDEEYPLMIDYNIETDDTSKEAPLSPVDVSDIVINCLRF